MEEVKLTKTAKAREFCDKVREVAKEYDLPFFVVTDGASAISNNGCEAIKNARLCHEKWEEANGHDSKEDWTKN